MLDLRRPDGSWVCYDLQGRHHLTETDFEAAIFHGLANFQIRRDEV